MATHLSNLKDLLHKTKLDAALISSVPDIIYLTDFAYFSPHEREAFLLITLNKNYIFTDARYSHAVQSQIKDFTLEEIGHGKSFKNLFEEIAKKENIKKLGLDKANLTINEFERIKDFVEDTKHFSLSPLRTIKEKKEIERIKKACDLGDEAFSYIIKNIKEGMTEKEIAYELEKFMRENGCEPSFPTIIAFEENAAIPHHKTDNRKLKTGELILLDFGVQYENYCSDMTRTICFGKASEEKKKVHQTVLAAQQAAINLINNYCSSAERSREANNSTSLNNMNASAVDKAARELIINGGYPSIPHSLGHGIGLEVHETPSLSPRSEDILQEGMVFSIEPGIYLNDKRGVRIEDIFTIQNGKLLQLTQSSKELIEINS